MNEYVIFADSACDIKRELLGEWGVPFESLTYKFDNEEKIYFNDEIPTVEFYAKMKEGGVAKTAAVNPDSFKAAFENTFKAGKDVLYLGFSSGLSTTFNSARIALNDLKESYPQRKGIVVDTLGASAGIGILIYIALEKQKAGATIEEVAEHIESIKLNLCHWFTVDDLVYLKRGGRVSPAAAFFGNMIGIKPVLHVDNDGHLVPVSKVRGRKTSITTIADKYGELALDKEGGIVYISHADCQKDAEELANILGTRYGAKVSVITDVGPVIGAHAGPGTLALFFLGSER